MRKNIGKMGMCIAMLSAAGMFAACGSAGTSDSTTVSSETTTANEEQSSTAQVITEAATECTHSSNITKDKISTSSESKVGATARLLSDGESLKDMTFSATASDTSALRVSNYCMASIENCTVQKTDGSASSADNSSFYGQNAGIQAMDGGVLAIKNCKITDTAKNSTGVFAYNYGVIYISDTTVDVTGGGAGGIQVAGAGELYATNCTVNSESKAAIRSDRGGGILKVNGGTYTSNGSSGCPAIYSTANITAINAVLKANHSRAVIIEGKNSVTIKNCDVTGHDESTKEGSILGNVLLYQSASGDASVGTSEFTMSGGTLSAGTGSQFCCTNTSSIINLDNVKITNSSDNVFLTASKGRWGKDGSNGGKVTLNASNQSMTGDIIVDEISSLSFTFSKSQYTGAINKENSSGEIKITMDADSSWTLTDDSYITEFSGDISKVNMNGHHLYVNGKQM